VTWWGSLVRVQLVAPPIKASKFLLAFSLPKFYFKNQSLTHNQLNLSLKFQALNIANF